ncbi:uncharacterized protein CTRU02_200069 [Colletotrichum truncatum]|uniref:Uncharacterized protein n=1 Tax=Colletotrichum truncatum TaxID=5467 RepID=A0ACC3ZE28_COLTU|nr:uncharacterized protein CTRU02_04944 [Colletotrichum truncatum]KAF6794743.1 hypothetical protein CTRU02_04944 [Colletotrichum truncatum]
MSHHHHGRFHPTLTAKYIPANQNTRRFKTSIDFHSPMSPRSKSDLAIVTQTVNALLLRTFALLQTPLSSTTLRLALQNANAALETATKSRRFDLEPRAHLYRGHVLRAWGRWRAAWQAYIRAASVKGIGFSDADVESLTRECWQMMRAQQQYNSSWKEILVEKKVIKSGLFERDEATFDEPRNEDIETHSDGYIEGMYILLNENGEVVGSRESLPDLRSVRGRGSVHRSSISISR